MQPAQFFRHLINMSALGRALQKKCRLGIIGRGAERVHERDRELYIYLRIYAIMLSRFCLFGDKDAIKTLSRETPSERRGLHSAIIMTESEFLPLYAEESLISAQSE